MRLLERKFSQGVKDQTVFDSFNPEKNQLWVYYFSMTSPEVTSQRYVSIFTIYFSFVSIQTATGYKHNEYTLLKKLFVASFIILMI